MTESVSKKYSGGSAVKEGQSTVPAGSERDREGGEPPASQ